MIGGYYLLQLFLMVVLVGGMAVLSLWLYKKLQPGLPFGATRERAVRVIDAVPMGPMSRLAVVEFGGKRILIAVSRGRVDTIAEAPAPNFVMPDE
jgi:flagellar protein FliO/FliZ